MDMLGTGLGHTSLHDLGLDVHSHGGHEHHHPHQPLPPHRPLSPPMLHPAPPHSVESSFSPSSSHLPSSTVKIKPGRIFFWNSRKKKMLFALNIFEPCYMLYSLKFFSPFRNLLKTLHYCNGLVSLKLILEAWLLYN